MNSPNSLSVNSSKSLPIITTFVNAELNLKVRSIMINNEPYFVGKDVAEILGYSNSRKAISDHVDDEDKGVTKWNTLGGNQDLTIINESGLYSLILSSKLPSAKKIKHWVTSEVLPSIRKNGVYSVPKTFAEALRLAAEQQEQITVMKPKADVYDRICNAETLKSVETVASNLGYGKNNFFALMRGMGIFYYSTKDADGKKVNLPKQEYKDRGYFVTKEEPYNRGDKDCLYTKIYVTGKGEIWLAKKLTEETAEAFMEKGEAEYHKIIDKTAENYLEKAIKNCPESNNTLVDKIQTFTFKQVADAIGEEESTIINFCKAKRWINNDNIPVYMPNNNYFLNGKLTVEGRDHIIAVFSTIARAEKGMKQFSCGKGE